MRRLRIEVLGPGFRIFTCMFAMGIASCVYAQGPSASVATKRRELQEVERQLEQKKIEIERYQRETERLQRDVSQLTGEKSHWQSRIKGFERLVGEAEQKRAELKARIGALELAEDRWHGVLSREINGYLKERLLESDYFGSDDVWDRAFRRAAIMEKVVFIRGLGGTRMSAEIAANEARDRSIQLQTKTAIAVAERQQRESLLREKQQAFLETQEKVARTQKDVAELRDSAAALTHLVRALERKSYGRGRKIPPATAFAQAPHSLPWPADGRVVAGFGRQFIPELKTYVIHQGIRLSTLPNAPVHPVRSGKVIFAGPFRSYGSVIIVDHGKSFYTIYGKLGRTLKKPGERVDVADTLGTAANDGPAGSLYFEMRQSADALDPLAWLRRRD